MPPMTAYMMPAPPGPTLRSRSRLPPAFAENDTTGADSDCANVLVAGDMIEMQAYLLGAGGDAD